MRFPLKIKLYNGENKMLPIDFKWKSFISVFEFFSFIGSPRPERLHLHKYSFLPRFPTTTGPVLPAFNGFLPPPISCRETHDLV